MNRISLKTAALAEMASKAASKRSLISYKLHFLVRCFLASQALTRIGIDTRHRVTKSLFFMITGLAVFSVRSEIPAPCIPTAADALGPFYVSETAARNNLNRFGRPGEPLRVNGRILDAGQPGTGIPHARLEIWQADGQGHYHPAANGPASRFADEDIDLRGTVYTDDDGRYAYMTIMPGDYPPRPRHIHYRISAAGYRTLVTQHYLFNDATGAGPVCRSGTPGKSGEAWLFESPPIYLLQQ